MTSTVLPNNTLTVRAREPVRWSAIFAGTFAFLAVEATFGVLGTASLAPAMNSNTARVSGMSTGVGIWILVLTVISLYVAGHVAGRLSGATRKLDGMYHGLVTFGLCIFTSILTTAMILGSTTPVTSPANNVVNAGTLVGMISTMGWWLFFTLVLGGWAAMGGASNAVSLSLPGSVREIRDNDTRRVA